MSRHAELARATGDESDAGEILRFPKAPYPGLRPFLDHEAALLFGRSAQVDEIIEHLSRRQFVAVIGGSGSGKSSLVRAGVVPRLRSYGIPDAGDYWIPMVCTPGTNARRPGSGRVGETPLYRFAWKFCRLLVPLQSPEDERRRVEEVAEVLRRNAGISQLLRGFVADLKPRPGLSPGEARLLLVVDQFEELFHPTNKGEREGLIDDARLLVERIIEHFFHPHPQCYVVLTMRSEHLNDCASFLELPDAINAAFYLVRRLDPAQLERAITEPARSYLRVRVREEGPGECLPTDIRFADEVLARVLYDTQAIASDPDHLPLLQHLLSRTWSSAVARWGPQGRPASIEMEDLACAVLARDDAIVARLGDENVLRASLVNQAEAVYARHPERQDEIDRMLRCLAFKDPNSGTYSQQRIHIDDSNRERLATLAGDGLISGVNYLFWDAENPEQVTLKVSHESFIRGWPRFRDLVDREAERLEALMELLRLCRRWRQERESRKSQCLLEGSQLHRMRDAGILDILQSPTERAYWFRFLAYVHDGREYRELDSVVDQFVGASLAREEEHNATAATHRWIRVLFTALCPVALAALGYSMLVQGPVLTSSNTFLNATKTVAGLKPPESMKEARERLREVLDAAASMTEPGYVPNAFLRIFGRQRHYQNVAMEVSEPPVNGVLRATLTGFLWVLPTSEVSDEPEEPAADHRSIACEAASRKGSTSPVRGVVYAKKGAFAATAESPQRALLVTKRGGQLRTIQTATLNKSTSGVACAVGKSIWFRPPDEFRTTILIGPTLEQLLTLTVEQDSDERSIEVRHLSWALDKKEEWAAYTSSSRSARVEENGVFDALATLADSDGVGALSAMRVPGGFEFAAERYRLRLVADRATDLPWIDPASRSRLESATDRSCGQLLAEARTATQDIRDHRVAMFESEEHCFATVHGKPEEHGRESVVKVLVYLQPGSREPKNARPIATMHFGDQLSPASEELWVIEDTDYPGWVALNLGEPGKPRFVGVPWSRKALQKLGNDILAIPAAGLVR